uniref:HECT domain-containing protein n=1 Tax=Neogobius melanostomus TaxID=47308 RepID=A0A8C6WEB4_9GOBI
PFKFSYKVDAYVFFQCVYRFCDGLETLDVLNKVRQHPRAFLPLLCFLPEPLTADKVDSLFQISWSEEGKGPTKLGDLLAFTTGSNVIPPMGLTPAPTIEFQMGKYPIANTCANCLRLPIHHRYEDFKMNMDFGFHRPLKLKSHYMIHNILKT